MSSFVVLDKDGKSTSVSSITTDDPCLEQLRKGQILTKPILEPIQEKKEEEFRRSSTPPPSSTENINMTGSLTPEPYHEFSTDGHSQKMSPVFKDKATSVIKEIVEEKPTIFFIKESIIKHFQNNAKYYVGLGLMTTLYLKLSEKLDEILHKNEC